MLETSDGWSKIWSYSKTYKICRGSTQIELKGMHLNHDFYVVVNKQCRAENALTGQ